jgi:hypothetical protein
MVSGIIIAAAALFAGVSAAPTKTEKRQAPAGVPDFVLKYGKYTHLPFRPIQPVEKETK